MKRRHINLLTWRFRFYLMLRTRLLQWLVVWSVVFLAALVTWNLKSSRLSDASDALALMESRCAPLKSMRVENQQMAARRTELNSHQSLLTRLDDEQVPYRLMGLVSYGVRQCSGGIRVQSVVVTRTLKKEAAPKNQGALKGKSRRQPQFHEITTLKLNGVADDNLTISHFVAALRDSGVFTSVDLKSSVGARVDEGRTQSFLVECILVGGDSRIATRQTSEISVALNPR